MNKENEADEILDLLRRLAAGIGASPDGKGYHAVHDLRTIQTLYETIYRLSGSVVAVTPAQEDEAQWL